MSLPFLPVRRGPIRQGGLPSVLMQSLSRSMRRAHRFSMRPVLALSGFAAAQTLPQEEEGRPLIPAKRLETAPTTGRRLEVSLPDALEDLRRRRRGPIRFEFQTLPSLVRHRMKLGASPIAGAAPRCEARPRATRLFSSSQLEPQTTRGRHDGCCHREDGHSSTVPPMKTNVSAAGNPNTSL